MNAILLAGGLGTRLRPLTFSIPKPLVPVGEKPILELVLAHLKSFGITDIYLAVGYKAELIQTYFQDGTKFGVNIRYHQEEKRLGTAGPLRLIRDRFTLAGPLLVMNADIITEIDLQDLFRFHTDRGAALTVGVRPYSYTIPYGVLQADGDRVVSIEERPSLAFLVSGGIYVVTHQVLDLIPPGEFLDMPDFIQAAIKARYAVHAYQIRQKWVAIEDLTDLQGELKGVKLDPS
jgi:NDP-sugar pyrophosphorylase family protein